jgi:anti-sigma B factor antagonist
VPPAEAPQPMDADFHVRIDSRAGRTLVAPRGELDMATVAVLEATLAAQAGPVVLDLRELSFIDPTGLRLLIQAETRSAADGRHLGFVPGPTVTRLFELLDLADPLTYV